MSTALDFYDRFMIMGDFNLEPENQTLQNILNMHDLVNLMKDKTCWKSSSGSCIDLILTNRKYSFQFIYTLEIDEVNFWSNCHLWLSNTDNIRISTKQSF